MSYIVYISLLWNTKEGQAHNKKSAQKSFRKGIPVVTKARETRPPKLAELREIKDKMEDKFQYLFAGPDEDPEGNPTILRWSRKKKEQYIGSEKNGKATRWGVYWRKGEWVEE